MRIKIGSLNVSNNVFLAPMAGVTDMPFRLLCREQGCGMVYTEMVSAKGLYYGSHKSERIIEIHSDEHPIGYKYLGLKNISWQKWPGSYPKQTLI